MNLKVNLEKCLGNFTHNFRKVLLKKGCFEKFVMITLELEIGNFRISAFERMLSERFHPHIFQKVLPKYKHLQRGCLNSGKGLF